MNDIEKTTVTIIVETANKDLKKLKNILKELNEGNIPAEAEALIKQGMTIKNVQEFISKLIKGIERNK